MRDVRIGVVLPTFVADAQPVLDAARRAEDAGLDGVFVYDHLFPIGGSHRPALHGLTMLGSIAAVTERVALGPLVARISLLPAVELVESFATLHEISGGRVLAALGLGDKASEPECVAYGLAVPPLSKRAAALASVCDALSARGVTTWVGGRSHTARAIASEHAHGRNLWESDVSDFAEPGRAGLTLSWAGPCLVGTTSARVVEKRDQRPQLPGPAGTVEELVAHARSYADAGVSWMIYAPPDLVSDPSVVDLLGKVASSLRP